MDFVDSLILKLEDKNFRVRCNAVLGLGKKKDPRALSALLRALANRQPDDPDRKVNFYTILAFGKMGEYSILPLIQALKEDPSNPDDSWRRYWTAKALGQFEDKRVIEALINILKDPDYDVVAGAVESLERIDDSIGLEPLKTKALDSMKEAYERLKFKENYTTRLMKQIIEAWEKGDKRRPTPIIFPAD